MIFDCFGKDLKSRVKESQGTQLKRQQGENTAFLCLSDEIYDKLLEFIRPKMLH